MNWQKAIEKSKKGTCTRTIKDSKVSIRTIIRYKDGTGFTVSSNNGKVDYFLSRPAQNYEMYGFNDWQPSE